MKRKSIIALLAAVMVLAGTVMSFAGAGLELLSSYPENNQTNTSIENLGVKLKFNNEVNSDAAKKVNEKAIQLIDEDGKKVPSQVLFSDDEKGLVLIVLDTDSDYTVKNNSTYRCVIGANFVDNDGNTLGKKTEISFKTYNQKLNNWVNMGMMVVMFGGIMFFSVRQQKKEQEENDDKNKSKDKDAINPYKEAKRTGKSVEAIKAEIAKKEEKEAKRRARKKQEAPQEKHIENCAALLNNVYHVHAPAPKNKADRSITALNKLRKAEKAAAKAAAEAKKNKKK